MALRTSYADGEVLNAADVNAITTKVNQIDEDMIPKSGGTMTGTLGIGTSTTAEALSLIIRRLVADVGYRYLQWYVGSTGSAALSLRDADGAELNGFALTPDATLLSKALAVTGGGTGAKTAAGACQNLAAEHLGVGEAIPSNADLNAYTAPGVYYSVSKAISETLANTPWTLSGLRLKVYNVGNTAQLIQEISCNSLNGQCFRRCAQRADNTWTFGEWKQIIISGNGIVPVAMGGTNGTTGAEACANLGAVKKSGDTMTGPLNGTQANFDNIVRAGTTADRTAELAGSAGAEAGNECAYIRSRSGSTTSNGMYLYDDKTALLKPLTLASGGLGRSFASETDLKNYLKTLLGI